MVSQFSCFKVTGFLPFVVYYSRCICLVNTMYRVYNFIILHKHVSSASYNRCGDLKNKVYHFASLINGVGYSLCFSVILHVLHHTLIHRPSLIICWLHCHMGCLLYCSPCFAFSCFVSSVVNCATSLFLFIVSLSK